MTQLPVGPPAARAPRRPSVARPALRVVRPQPRAISHLPFVLLCAGVLAAGLIAVLLLNTALAKGSYEAHALEDRSAQLDEQQQQLSAALATRQGPQGLAARAQELGMVRPDSVRWLDLNTGAVSGAAAPARAGDQPSIVSEPSYLRSVTPTPSASPSTTPSTTPSMAAGASAGPSVSASVSQTATRTAGPTPSATPSASPGVAGTAGTTRPRTTATRPPAAADAIGR